MARESSGKTGKNRPNVLLMLFQNPKKEGGIEPILSAVNKSNYFIHWEKLLVKDGFPVPNAFLSSTFFMRENDYFIKIRPMEWDACIYLNEVNPATPY